MRISRILWAADKSKESSHALRWAEFLANRFGARVIGLSVIESPGVDTLEVPADLKKKISLVDRELGTREAKQLKRVQYILERKGVDAATEVVRGAPYREIIKAAHRHGVDLIAMGKTRLNLWARMLLGSTTTKVLRETHLPVLTVRQAAKKPVVKKIAVPSVFSRADSVALEWALELAETLGASVFLLHVIEAHSSWDKVKGGLIGRLRKVASDKLDAMLERVPMQKRKGVPVFTRIKAFPRPWSGVVSFVREERVDMIVMSTHARRGMPRLFLGSVAERVIRETPCPVVT
jgi:nucleotide-binding universal stress UspA family protein